MIIECYYCEVKVLGEVIAKHESFDPEVDPAPFLSVLIECPSCKNSLLGGYDLFDDGPIGELIRLWPDQETFASSEIPDICRTSIMEAKLCFKAKAYSATAVMCGRTLEGICVHHQLKSRNLSAALQELREKQVIDERIYLWSEQLRKHRNIGAHASEEKVTRQDAKDLLEFVTAICDYIFVLNKKFQEFMERKSQ